MSPDAHTNAEHMLDVGHGHTLYVHDWGNPKAKTPIFFLHGGPGSSTRDKYKLAFNPEKHRVIFHDQRGAGRSIPAGRWHHNNTQELAGDISRIADTLHIKSFIITGDSWGSALALYYALQEPRRVVSLVIGGVFTASQEEIDWLDTGVFQSHFPDAWQRYLDATPKQFRDAPTAYHLKRALSRDEQAAKESAFVYSQLELSVLSLDDAHEPMLFDSFDPTGTIMEMRYLSKRCYLPDRYILDNAHKLTMPIYIVQGRYDFVCPPKTAFALSQAAPHVELTWTIAGHRNEHENLTVKRVLFSGLAS